MFDNGIKSAILREAFPGMVGQQIFCPACRNVLDCRRAVNLEIWNRCEDNPNQQTLPGVTRPERKQLVDVIICISCVDTVTANARYKGLHPTIAIDGRELWPTNKPRKTRKAKV